MSDLPLNEPAQPASVAPTPPKTTRKPNGAGAVVKTQLARPEEYARLDLLAPVTTANGDEAREVIVYRPTCKVMCDILDTLKNTVQIERFVKGCVRAVDENDQPVPFTPGTLCSIDSAELTSVIIAMSEDAEQVHLDDIGGDGVTSPILYTLQKPIKMHPGEDAESVHQIEFMARKVSDVSEFLDARGETLQFHTFMRSFGKPLGMRYPMMTDGLINALDFIDYLVIRRQIMGKFTNPQRRWKPASSSGQ